ncbi:MAG: LamG-like jellyroll fold domain-containing protein [Candidatus Hatepunaea meridiana]|nr:LamG-like jellyroll fold domain-containing protein [Candidatus Hatepunaea meridiana]
MYIYNILRWSLFFLLIPLILDAQPDEPFEPDEHTLALWHMDRCAPDSLWTASFSQFDGEYVHCGIVTSDSCYLIGSYGSGGNNWRANALIKVNSNGEEVWSRRYETGELAAPIHDIAELNNGNYLVIGNLDDRENRRRIPYLLLTNSEGDSLDFIMYGRSINSFCSILLEENSILLAGTVYHGSLDMFLMRINSEWDSLSSVSYGSEVAEWLLDIISSNDGGYLLVGVSQDNDGQHAYLIKVDEDFEVVWERRYGNSTWDIFESVISTDDGYMCCGVTLTEEDGYDYWLMRIDEDGEIIWSNTYGGESTQHGYDIVRNSDGDFVFAGIDGYHYNTGLGKIDENGHLIWKRVFEQDVDNRAYRIVRNHDNSYTLIGSISVPEVLNGRDVYLLRTCPDYDLGIDFSDNDNHGILHGENRIGEGHWENALEFSPDGGGYLLVPDNESLHPTEFTIEGWFRMNDERQHNGALITKRIDEERKSYCIRVNSEESLVEFQLRTEDDVYAINYETDPDDGEWHYIAGTYDCDWIRLFYDDEIVGWSEVSGSILYGDGPLIIGNADENPGGDFQFFGLIDEVRISDVPREYLDIKYPDACEVFPVMFYLDEPYPNPFNNQIGLSYTIPNLMYVNLNLTDQTGRLVDTITEGMKETGFYSLSYNASHLPAGIYFCNLKSGQFMTVKKILLVK